MAERTGPIDDILTRVRSYDCPLVEVTGGEPLAQPDTGSLLHDCVDEGFTVLLETSGAIDTVSVDPRGPHYPGCEMPGERHDGTDALAQCGAAPAAG